jgi:alpha-tubulin suppressor-like RCC1 family protein
VNTSADAPRQVTGTGSYAQIAAGFIHTCALASDGSATCWGGNDYDQLGTTTANGAECGGRRCSSTPTPVSGNLRFVALSAGWVANCGITLDGQTWCWGGGAYDGRGYLGDGELRRSTVPVHVRADSQFVSVTLGDGHSCALTRSGTPYCWGQNDLGQLGDGTHTDRPTPVPLATPVKFKQLSAGAYHVCGVTSDGDVMCWGDNRWGQLGARDVAYNALDAASPVPLPVRIEGAVKFRQVAAGWEHTCAIDVAGTAYCWGRNEDARQLGDGSVDTHRGTPAPVATDTRFTSLVAGPLATCGRAMSGETYCWGGNYYGGLGNGETNPRGVDHPVRTQGGPFNAVAIGQGHTCGINVDTQIDCWGDRTAGQY